MDQGNNQLQAAGLDPCQPSMPPPQYTPGSFGWFHNRFLPSPGSPLLGATHIAPPGGASPGRRRTGRFIVLLIVAVLAALASRAYGQNETKEELGKERERWKEELGKERQAWKEELGEERTRSKGELRREWTRHQLELVEERERSQEELGKEREAWKEELGEERKRSKGELGRERARHQWELVKERERSQEELGKERMKWQGELAKETTKWQGELVKERGRWKEELWREVERWERALGRRIPQGAFWDGVRPAADCRAYNTREYWGVLRNIPKHWTDLEACMNMPVEIEGVSIKRPHRCAYVEGSPHIQGYWTVDWDQLDCRTWLQDFHDAGCTNPGSGMRRIEAQVVGILNKDEQNWRLLCATTPITWNHTTYNAPTYCDERRFGRKFAIWDVPDEGC